MSFQLNISPQAEARLLDFASLEGIAPAEVIARIIEERFAPAGIVAQRRISAKNAAAIAYFDRRLTDEATNDAEEIRKADADVDELMQNLNRNRIESGERPLFP